MGCKSSKEYSVNGVTANNITRFKVQTDGTLADYQCERIRDGILEVGEDELIHHVKGNKYVWSYNCLRRYGVAPRKPLSSQTFANSTSPIRDTETINFLTFDSELIHTVHAQSGRRCSTGPGLFAFRCRHADIIHNVFQDRLTRYTHLRSDGRMRMMPQSIAQSPIRYSERLTQSVPVEPYLDPISVLQSASDSSHQYINTNGVSTDHVDLKDGSVRPINYAILDLASNGEAASQGKETPVKHGVMYVDINNHSSDEDDDAFLPANQTQQQYINVSTLPNGQTVQNGHSRTGTQSYVNIEGASSQGNGLRKITYSEKTGGSEGRGAPYIIIDFQKTVALANTAKTVGTESPQEGVRKTRHDSSAENLE